MYAVWLCLFIAYQLQPGSPGSIFFVSTHVRSTAEEKNMSNESVQFYYPSEEIVKNAAVSGMDAYKALCA